MCEKNSDRKPLIHCITNPIAMNQSANAVLAIGGRPVMAEHPKEVSEITETADALLLNFGHISDIKIQSMKISIKAANKKGIPVVVDVCGCACSKLRLDFFKELMDEGSADVIKGNYSEILALFDQSYKGSGVDADDSLDQNRVETAAKYLAEQYDSMVLATGKADILAKKGGDISHIKEGDPQMASVTGTGCMLGAIIATALALDNSQDSVEKAVSFFGKCGEKARTDKGSGTFMVNLLDALSTEWK